MWLEGTFVFVAAHLSIQLQNAYLSLPECLRHIRQPGEGNTSSLCGMGRTFRMRRKPWRTGVALPRSKMKFGKEFKKQKVPEWTEAYVDYNGLKRILREILQYKQSRQPPTPLRALQQRLSLNTAFSGLGLPPPRDRQSGRDVEEQVIDVKISPPEDGSTKQQQQRYKTDFLKRSESGGEIEMVFFNKLDQELNKVNTFYKDKTEEMIHEASQLTKQMEALTALRIKVVAPDHFGDSNSRTSSSTDAASENMLGSTSQSSHRTSDINEAHTNNSGGASQEADNVNEYKEDPMKILDHVKINNTIESPLSTIKGIFKDSNKEDLSFNKEELRKVEERLKNITSRRASRSYMKIVDDSCIGSSDEVSVLLEKVEATFIKHFSNSNRRKGMKSLRPKSKREKHILSMYMYSANIYFWRRYRVNYPFIFSFKRGTELGHAEVFLLSNGLAVLSLASFLATLHLDLGSKASNYKTITELVALVILFCPFNIVYRSSRFFFIRCLFRCICAPMYKAIRSLELYICYYGMGEYSRRQNKCHSHGVYTVFYFIVAIIPYWLRFLQCLRRLCDDKDAIHGYNGLKYFTTIVAVLARTTSELKKGKTWMVFAMMSSVVAAVVNTYWDIVVDWGLLRRRSKNPFLRDKLVVSHKSVYFAAMVGERALEQRWKVPSIQVSPSSFQLL
ncbi:hypothetical protein Tsubulata_019304 [Turnera subulata]|uniref:EXS domain-containing protein n=1 Tax=Turnera subulata TaxID=218843 RepID=A0A9Q0JQW1_9ROSI|nr:hypothetical protein Tsubulata_019304 [Turnera subulata]